MKKTDFIKGRSRVYLPYSREAILLIESYGYECGFGEFIKDEDRKMITLYGLHYHGGKFKYGIHNHECETWNGEFITLEFLKKVLATPESRTAYKLLRERKDGSLTSLFVDKKTTLPIGLYMTSKDHNPKNLKRRPGWHCCQAPIAPHLKMKLSNGEKRVWCEVEVIDYAVERRPKSQGGEWIIADIMRINRKLSDDDVESIIPS